MVESADRLVRTNPTFRSSVSHRQGGLVVAGGSHWTPFPLVAVRDALDLPGRICPSLVAAGY